MKKIYVLCPANAQTGGTELAHQLVDYLNNTNRKSYIVYSDDMQFVEAKIPQSFQKYNINKTINIEDTKDNCVVIPEIYFHLSKKMKKIKLIFWWMSFDNYCLNAGRRYLIQLFIKRNFSFRELISRIYHFNSNCSFHFSDIKKIKKDRIIHVYQSRYASDMLYQNGIYEQLSLTDYINLEFVKSKKSFPKRENIVLYNPKKGLPITQKLIKSMPNVEFIALKGLSRNQLNELFRTAKVYIDFGNHPGKDRIPREACVNGCCVIVGKNGSAQYFEDVPILAKYKFDRKQIGEIKERIFSIFKNYEKSILDFEFYQNRIKEEKNIFHNEIEVLLKKLKIN